MFNTICSVPISNLLNFHFMQLLRSIIWPKPTMAVFVDKAKKYNVILICVIYIVKLFQIIVKQKLAESKLYL